MIAAEHVLNANGIHLPSYTPGRHHTTCPQCSAQRTFAHRALKCLGVTIDGRSVRWGCNHCSWTGPSKGSGDGGEGKPLTSYVYRDKGGAILFRKVRNAPGREPRFFLQKWNGLGWERGAGGVDTSILYRADELAKAIADGREVIVAEGEKDVDRLWALGFVATCNAHGASKPDRKPKWVAGHSAQLAGADIVVLNDNDPAGYEHAETACRLSAGVVRRVRRLDLKDHWPDIPKGGDVSDWLNQGHTCEELAAAISAAPDYTPRESDGAKPRPGPADSDDAEFARLARLSPVEYERARKAATESLGIRAPLLDRLVAAERAKLGLDRDDGKQGRPIEFPEIKPWPTPVDGPTLLDDLAGAVGGHVVISEHQRVAVALWCVHAYLLDRTMISPRLAIRSAIKGSGKTTLLDVVGRLVPRPLSAAGVSAAVVFRVIAAHGPTLLIDEGDTLFSKDGDEALRGVLNAGHRKGGTVLRSVGDDYEPRAFPCYAATAIALIGQLPGTLADRSIDIVLARRRPNEAITPFRLDQTDHLDALARRIARWAMDNGERLTRDPAMPPGLHNRAADNWRPLLAIADAAGGPWPDVARKAAAALAGGDIDEVSRTELLLSDIRDIFAVPELDEITSAALIERLIAIVPRPWAEYGRSGKPITQNKLARLLNPLGIGPHLIGLDRLAGYRRARFDDAFERYLAPLSPLPPFQTSQVLKPQENRATSELSQPLSPKRPERFENLGNHGIPTN